MLIELEVSEEEFAALKASGRSVKVVHRHSFIVWVPSSDGPVTRTYKYHGGALKEACRLSELRKAEQLDDEVYVAVLRTLVKDGKPFFSVPTQ